jgi:putative ABC transport system permease protein
MGIWQKTRSLTRNFFRRDNVERDLDAEVRSYSYLLEEEKMSNGMNSSDARRSAHMNMGSTEQLKEEIRGNRAGAWLESLWKDVRFGARILSKNPGVTVIAIFTLALGIGANTAIFSVVKGVLLNSLPYPQSDRLVKLAASDNETPHPTTVSYEMVQDWKRRTDIFSSIGIYRDFPVAVTDQDKPEMLVGIRASAEYYEALGVQPILGRMITKEDDRPDRWRVVLLSYGFWQTHFGGNPAAVGQNLLLNARPYQILGVLPRDFIAVTRGGKESVPQVFAPLGYDSSLPYACRTCQHLQSVARLRDGVTLAQARIEMSAISARLAKEFSNDYSPSFTTLVTPLLESQVKNVRSVMLLVLGATGLVLLIACANVASLLLSVAASRRRELALRAALGAGRIRLLRQVLTESVLLTLIGGAAGILVAVAGIRALIAWGPSDIPRLNSVALDGGVLAFTIGICLVTGILAGLLPALQAARVDQREALQEGGRGSVGAGRKLSRGALIVSEVALAFVLTVGTSLLALSLVRVLKENPGFETQNLYTVSFTLIGPKYAQPGAVSQTNLQALEKVRAIPGVESVALTNNLPLSGGWNRNGFIVQDRPMKDSEAPDVDSYFVTHDYFRTMGIPLIRGRLFTASDEAVAATVPVAIISATTAKQMFPGRDPLGKKIQLGGRNDRDPWAEIIGIVPDIRQYALDADATAEAYWLSAFAPSNFVVRGNLPSNVLTKEIASQLSALDKNIPLSNPATMEELIVRTVSQRRFVTTLVGGFGFLALLLAGIGIYGVMSYHVSQRGGEIGIRMALGAAPSSILKLVADDALRLAIIGSLTGTALALAVTRFLASQLYHVGAADPTAYAISITVIAADMFLACWIPARRAMRVDPMVALRHE